MRLSSLVIVATALLLAACSGSAVSLQPTVAEGAIGMSASGDFLGCPYPSGNVYQYSILNAPVDKRSSAYIKAMTDGGGGAAFMATIPTYEYVNIAAAQTPLVAVHPLVYYIMPYSPIPWKSSFYISPLGDAHSLVLQAQDCHYYEGYETTYSASGILTMFNNTHIALKRPFHRPRTGALSTSTGIPLGLLAVRPEELTAGVISHALGWNIVDGSVATSACVSPAGRVACSDGIAYAGPPSDTPMPWGSHARLNASFDISGFSREAKIVATAMKTYGMYVYDAGCCNEILLTNDEYGAPTWTSKDAADLETITPNNLEIVPPP